MLELSRIFGSIPRFAPPCGKIYGEKVRRIAICRAKGIRMERPDVFTVPPSSPTRAPFKRLLLPSSGNHELRLADTLSAD